jgi:nicotinamide mononucleotide transporter pnuC
METNINKPTFLEKVQKYTSPTEILKEFNTKLNNFKKNLSAIVTETRKYTLWELIVICWNDLFAKRSLFGWLYLIILSAIPAVFEFTKSGPIDTLGLWTSITGIVCVILVTEGRASNYFFGLINAVVYLIMALQSGFYGEVITTLYFLISQPIGLYLWLSSFANHEEKQEETFQAKRLDLKGWIKYLAITTVMWLGMGFAYQSIGSNRPFRDSVTDGTNGVGQLLMNNLYAEQWIFWIATNIFSIYLWWGSGGNLQIVVMYLVYTINSIYGWYKWNQSAKAATANTELILERKFLSS